MNVVFCVYVADQNPEMQAFLLHESVNKLSPPLLATMRALFGLLGEVARESDANRMGAARLADIFAPVLFNDGSRGAAARTSPPHRDAPQRCSHKTHRVMRVLRVCVHVR